MVFQRLYGLILETEEAIPGVPCLQPLSTTVDVRIRLRSADCSLLTSDPVSDLFYASKIEDEYGTPILRVGFLDRYLAMFYCDGTRFLLGRRGDEVLATWPEPLTLDDVAPYVVGPVLGVVLRLRGVVPLHASAVCINGHAIVLAGPAGAGKSTTAAAFAKCGYRVISDDVVALQEQRSRFMIPPGYPRVNLWAESVQGIWGKNRALPLISPSWDKHFMALELAKEFETSSLPLGAVYVLKRGDTRLNAHLIQPLKGKEALVGVLGNTYMNYLPDPECRRQEFELLGRLVARVPIRCVHVSPDLSMLPDLCAAIDADISNLVGKGVGAKSSEHLLHVEPS